MRHAVALLIVALLCSSAHAIINPFFTPKELTEQADVIYVGTVTAAGKDWTFNITQTLKGEPAKKHVISLAKCKAANAADIAALFKEKGRQTFILFSGTMKRAREEEAQESTFAQLEKAWLKLRAAGGEVIRNLPGDCCVEVECVADKSGIRPTWSGELPPQCAAMMQTNINVQDLVVRAILEERRDHVYHAAMFDPNTAATLTLPRIFELVDAMIEAHGDLMPAFLR